MKIEYSFFLNLVYVWGLAIILVSVIYDYHANVHAILLLIAFSPILITHIILSYRITAWQTNKRFFLLSLLWFVKFSTFSMSELFNILINIDVLFVAWADLFLLIVLLFIIFLSFIFRIPFYFERTSGTKIIFIGILGLVLTLWISTMIVASLLDLYWTHTSLIIKSPFRGRF